MYPPSFTQPQADRSKFTATASFQSASPPTQARTASETPKPENLRVAPKIMNGYRCGVTDAQACGKGRKAADPANIVHLQITLRSTNMHILYQIPSRRFFCLWGQFGGPPFRRSLISPSHDSDVSGFDGDEIRHLTSG